MQINCQAHVAERMQLGLPPVPLRAEQVAELKAACLCEAASRPEGLPVLGASDVCRLLGTLEQG